MTHFDHLSCEFFSITTPRDGDQLELFRGVTHAMQKNEWYIRDVMNILQHRGISRTEEEAKHLTRALRRIDFNSIAVFRDSIMQIRERLGKSGSLLLPALNTVLQEARKDVVDPERFDALLSDFRKQYIAPLSENGIQQ